MSVHSSQPGQGRWTNLYWLTGQRIDRASGPDLKLVVDHMSQSLIVDQTEIDIRVELFTRDAGVHRFVSVIVVSGSFELFPKVVDWPVLVRESE
jgi:hypothetical protein